MNSMCLKQLCFLHCSVSENHVSANKPKNHKSPTPVQSHTNCFSNDQCVSKSCSMFTDSVIVPWLPWDEQALEESRASG